MTYDSISGRYGRSKPLYSSPHNYFSLFLYQRGYPLPVHPIPHHYGIGVRNLRAFEAALRVPRSVLQAARLQISHLQQTAPVFSLWTYSTYGKRVSKGCWHTAGRSGYHPSQRRRRPRQTERPTPGRDPLGRVPAPASSERRPLGDMDFGPPGLSGGPGLWEIQLGGEGPMHGDAARRLIGDVVRTETTWPLATLPSVPAYWRATSTELCPCLGSPVSSKD
jgi:hypothetical protein